MERLASETDTPVTMPRQRKRSRKIDDCGTNHTFTIQQYYKQQYCAIIDTIVSEIQSRFSQPALETLTAIEQIIVNAANGKISGVPDCDRDKLAKYSSLLNLTDLDTQLSMLANVMKTVNEVHKTNIKLFTSVRSVANTMIVSPFAVNLCSQVSRLCQIYMTVPMTSATAERSFSVMWRIQTVLRQTMTQPRLNACMMLHVHKDRTDSINIHEIAANFVNGVDDRVRYFGKISD